MIRHRIFYKAKRFIPRELQVAVRRRLVRKKAAKVSCVWPIDPSAGQQPRGWNGWPRRKAFALILTHDVETARGQEKVKKLAQIEQEFGFRSSYNFVPERYKVSTELRHWLRENGFEVGVHDLKHDGSLFSSQKSFIEQSPRINHYIREWDSKGFRAGAMHHNLEWIGRLDINYDASTFDTDPFEPQPDGVGTIFPFCCQKSNGKPFVELPYTLAQDFTVFVLFKETSIRLWKMKLDWIVQQGGMALLNVHPDYISFSGDKPTSTEYPIERYQDLLRYCLDKYTGQYWNALPRNVADFVLNHAVATNPAGDEPELTEHKGK